MRPWFLLVVLVSVRGRDATADPCVAPGAEPVMLAMAKGKVSYCFKITNAKADCFTTDLATGKTAIAASPAPLGQIWPTLVPTPAPVKITRADSGKNPQVCHRDGAHCKTFAMTHAIDQGIGLIAAENATLTVVALATLQWIDTFDMKTGKRIASFSTGPKKSSCNSLEFAGETLVVGEQVDCAQAVYNPWLATTAGVKLADVGGASPIVIGEVSMAKVDGDTYAFATWAGDTLIYQDVKTGKVGKRLTLGPATTDGPAYLLGDGSSLVVVYGGTHAGDVTLIDPKTDKLTPLVGKRCAK